MKAVNLHFLTRVQDHETMSGLFQALSGLPGSKMISPHEAASLCSLTALLTDTLRSSPEPVPDWLKLLDGFFFSYIIEHIGKEFDLLKISSDGKCALNIELKSEDIGEDRIKKQLEQNRYYLSHAADTIFSFTYVMDTGTLYMLNDKGYFRTCPADELIRVLMRPSWQNCQMQDIDRFFRSSDYLISPVAAPEKFLQGQYFLTNQQFDFKRRILEHIKEEKEPVISVTGSAGTGKTLLLFDLALHLSRKNRVLLLHSGPLRQGHLQIDERLKNVDIRSSADLRPSGPDPGRGSCLLVNEADIGRYSCLLIDEADHLPEEVLKDLLKYSRKCCIPVILAYDPHHLLSELLPEDAGGSSALLSQVCTLPLAFSGNIRINRPVFSFLRTLLHLKDHAGRPDYSCIDVLYAKDQSDQELIMQYYLSQGYEWIRTKTGRKENDRVIAQEYGKVLILMDEDYYYDEALYLCVKDHNEAAIRLLYEGLSRTRERLCLIIRNNQELFSSILKIRLHLL